MQKSNTNEKQSKTRLTPLTNYKKQKLAKRTSKAKIKNCKTQIQKHHKHTLKLQKTKTNHKNKNIQKCKKYKNQKTMKT